MKVVILAGGFGIRLSEVTNKIPKPMIRIYGQPIIEYIIKIYVNYGYTDFLIATGYKSILIKKYFKKFKKEASKYLLKNSKKKIQIKIVNTGLRTMTGGRLKKLEKYFDKKKNENFMLTYGDGISNVDLIKLLKYHKRKNKIATVTAIRPLSRYGVLKIKNGLAISFKEKRPIQTSWINGGFFVFNTKIFKFLKNTKTVLEEHPLQNLAYKNNLSAYKHYGFWHSFDTKRDLDSIRKKYSKKKLINLLQIK